MTSATSELLSAGSVNLVDHPQRHRRIMLGFRWRGAAGQRL
jgi:hypothetical protein